ncbi:MAG: hypothetical protein JJT89_04475 [Nitriliruptoraceae bacterium]|nr:hypothetical protein [Nitriliruptoraceae bacterium]
MLHPAPLPCDTALDDLTWRTVPRTLTRLASDQLARDGTLRPQLLAFDGDRPMARAGLRPFDADGLLPALIEVLSLLLPLGADRLALLATGRMWPLDEGPQAADAPEVRPAAGTKDARRPVVLIVTADAADGPCRITSRIHPLLDPVGDRARAGHTSVRLGARLQVDEGAGGELRRALHVLLDERDELVHLADGFMLAGQFGRVQLLGHDLALSARTWDELEDRMAI